MSHLVENNNSSENELRVLSLFDGISCGRIALDRAGFKVKDYYAYEIEQNAIKISRYNYPSIHQCGDVFDEDFSKYESIDLLIGDLHAPSGQVLSVQKRQSIRGKLNQRVMDGIYLWNM